jgi:hypothetical protein
MLMSDRHINASALEHSQQSQASVLQIYPLAIDSNHVSYPSFHFFSTTAFGSTTPLKKQRVFAVLTIHHGFLRRIFYPTPTILNASSESIPDEASLRSISAAPPQRMFVAYLLMGVLITVYVVY